MPQDCSGGRIAGAAGKMKKDPLAKDSLESKELESTELESAELESTELIPEELALHMRRLAHDLSNALEIVVQTSYLLGRVELKEPAAGWLRMLDSGVNKALETNQQLRDYVKLHTPK
jgi:hypothetical protein